MLSLILAEIEKYSPQRYADVLRNNPPLISLFGDDRPPTAAGTIAVFELDLNNIIDGFALTDLVTSATLTRRCESATRVWGYLRS